MTREGIPIGGIHVDLGFEALLRLRWNSVNEDGAASSLIPLAVQDFEAHGKRKFKGPGPPCSIQVGKPDLYDIKRNVVKGKLYVDGWVRPVWLLSFAPGHQYMI